jgi:DNA helicase-2/ATP-dependent DNA helicase PcrA
VALIRTLSVFPSGLAHASVVNSASPIPGGGWQARTLTTLDGFVVKNEVHEHGAVQAAETASASPPAIVVEEEALLRVVLAKIDAPPQRSHTPVDDAATLIELRDALAEAKPEDQGPLLEQMHRIEALSRQRGRGESVPVDRRSPYFGHLRCCRDGRRRDVLIGQRGYVEPGGGVQIVDWRNAPVSRLFYRYDEGDSFEERLGEREVAGEVLARRTVTIVEAELRRVASAQGIFSREPPDSQWRSLDLDKVRLGVAAWAGAQPSSPQPGQRQRLGFESHGQRRADRFLPAIAALIDPRQFELISRPSSGVIVVQGTAGSGKTTIGLHRIAYLNFAEPGYFRPQEYAGHRLPARARGLCLAGLARIASSGREGQNLRHWAEEVRRASLAGLSCDITETRHRS